MSWTAKVTNVAVWERLHEKPEFLQNIKARKLGYFGHIMRQESLSIENAVITGLVPGNRSRGRPAMAWIDNIVEWTGMGGTQLVQAKKIRNKWRDISSSSRSIPPSVTMKD